MPSYWLMSLYIATQHAPIRPRPGEVQCCREFRNIVYPRETEGPRDFTQNFTHTLKRKRSMRADSQSRATSMTTSIEFSKQWTPRRTLRGVSHSFRGGERDTDRKAHCFVRDHHHANKLSSYPPTGGVRLSVTAASPSRWVTFSPDLLLDTSSSWRGLNCLTRVVWNLIVEEDNARKWCFQAVSDRVLSLFQTGWFHVAEAQLQTISRWVLVYVPLEKEKL